MMTRQQITDLRSEITRNLTGCILPYWIRQMEDPSGGFYGRRDGNNRLHPEAERGAILYARILWTFSAAWRELQRPEYLEAATRAYDYIVAHFIDRHNGGVYWAVNPDGSPADTKKQFYAIAFTIYGLAEYNAATGSREALDMAMELFECIETHSRDRLRGGYIEALAADWSELADVRLSDKDANASKTMNTHLHILEAYTNLLRRRRTPELEEAVADLLRTFFSRIEHPRHHHLRLFFDDEWRPVADGGATQSFGHDIEASWLLLEAAEVLGDPALKAEALAHTRAIADAGLRGYCTNGSMLYERHPSGRYDNEKHWWVQAETLVGLLWLHSRHGRAGALEKAALTWSYIDSQIVDHQDGEWFWSRLPDGTPNRRDDKAGFWKCPYHNSRMCLEAMHILSKWTSTPSGGAEPS